MYEAEGALAFGDVNPIQAIFRTVVLICRITSKRGVDSLRGQNFRQKASQEKDFCEIGQGKKSRTEKAINKNWYFL